VTHSRRWRLRLSNFGKRHLSLIHDLPCGLCGASPVSAHHILEGRTPNRKSPDALAIPLCYDCHQGDRNGIHGQQFMWKIYKKSELDILAETYEKLYGGKS
jgi:hypothetical protein